MELKKGRWKPQVERFLRGLKMGDEENINFRHVIVKCKNIKAKESYRSLRMDYIQRVKMELTSEFWAVSLNTRRQKSLFRVLKRNLEFYT